MKRTKIVLSTLLATILLATQIIAVGAAPANQDTTPITGEINDVVIDTDTSTVVVTLTNELGEVQTVRISIEDALYLELITDDGSGPVVDFDKITTDVNIDPAIVIPDATDEAQHPVGSALSDFFSDLLGVNYETVMDYHDEGTGFGVIAQALWMTNALEGDSEMFAAILEAKKSKEYGEIITLPDGSVPQNWGQFRKAVMSDQEKSKENLGAIMSGRANDSQGNDGQIEPKNNGKNPDKDKSNNGKSDDKGNGKDKNKDKGKNKDK